jgi:hypothetical protein
MKIHLVLIALALSSAAWAAEPGTDTAPAADTAAPVTNAAQPAAEHQAAPAAADQKAEEQVAPAATDQKAEQAASQSGFSRGSVVRSVFTTAVKDREPVDKLNNDKTNANHIFFFTELRDMSGQTAIHRWEHDGKVAAEVKFNVRGPRWRVWSSKTFSPNATGEWKVSVINGAGEVIAEDMLDYAGPAAEQKPAATQAPAATQQPAAEQQPEQNPTTMDEMPK